MARYLLLAKYFDEHHGLHEKGSIIERPDDWQGPVETISEDGHLTFKTVRRFKKLNADGKVMD